MSLSPPTAEPSAVPATNGSEAPAIRTVDLTKSYPGTDFRAVDELNLRVGRGEVWVGLGAGAVGEGFPAGWVVPSDVGTGTGRTR